MVEFAPPKNTSISHAVRWIATGGRCLGHEDAVALNDYPIIDGEQFKNARLDLFLALRQKKLPSFGDFEINGMYRCANYDDDFSDCWKRYLSEYSIMSSEVYDNKILVDKLIEIPNFLWEEDHVDWNNNCLSDHDRDVEVRFLNVCVPTEELFNVFGEREVAQKDPEVPALTVDEKKSLLKLIAAMSIEGYRFNPNASKNPAVSDICSDLAKIGPSLDRKTILKWLREAAKEVAPDYEYKNK